KLHLGFIQVHILYHAKKAAFYGTWMIDELGEHGYRISPGTLYPMLHEMAAQGLLTIQHAIVNGKMRKYYSITKAGDAVFADAKEKALALVHELEED
ncbi:MAG: PadR family transcriptional regulator, partial [Eubacteriales bacterium]|nr:PadR family transcriptional regulator [Eubacteriales bacterium]